VVAPPNMRMILRPPSVEGMRFPEAAVYPSWIAPPDPGSEVPCDGVPSLIENEFTRGRSRLLLQAEGCAVTHAGLHRPVRLPR